MAGTPAPRGDAGGRATGAAVAGDGRAAAVAAALALLAAAVRTIVWHRTTAMMNDGPAFIGIAQRMTEGRWGEALAHDYHPLYPLVLAGLKPFFAGWDDAGAAASILAGAGAVVALYAFLRDAFGARVAWVGGLLLAVHPYAAPFSADVQSEGLYFALFLGAVAASWRALSGGRIAWAFGAGLLVGLAYLTRPEGLGVGAVAAGMVAGLAATGAWSWRRAVPWLSALAVGAGLVMAPYVSVLSWEAGNLTLTGKKSVTAILLLEGARAPEPAPGERRAGSTPPGQPTPSEGPTPGASPPPPPDAAPEPAGTGNAVLAIAEAVKRAFRLDHLLIAALGVGAVAGRPGLRGVFVLALLGLYGFVLLGLQLSAGYVSMRHVLAPCLLLLGYVALGLPVLGRWLLAVPRRLAGRRGPAPSGSALAVSLALLATASTIMALRPQREERAAVRAAAEWIAAERPDAHVLATPKRRDAWYADAAHHPLPPVPEGRASWIDVLAHDGVRFVLLEEDEASLYVGEEPPPTLRLLHETERHGRKAAVYEIRADAVRPDAPR